MMDVPLILCRFRSSGAATYYGPLRSCRHAGSSRKKERRITDRQSTARRQQSQAMYGLSPVRRQQQKAPPRRGFPDDNAGSVLAIAAQLEGLASDAGILELAQQAIEAFFRQLDQAEGLADLDATDGLPGQAALIEDSAQQVARGDAVAGTQGGAATGTPFGDRRRCTALATLAVFAASTAVTLASLAHRTGHQRLLPLQVRQVQRLTIGGLAQQRGGQ